MFLYIHTIPITSVRGHAGLHTQLLAHQKMQGQREGLVHLIGFNSIPDDCLRSNEVPRPRRPALPLPQEVLLVLVEVLVVCHQPQLVFALRRGNWL